MRTFILLILFMPGYVFAMAPECPLYSNKHNCLQSVEENYDKLLDFIKEGYSEDNDELIQAAGDTKHFESLACQKTCLN